MPAKISVNDLNNILSEMANCRACDKNNFCSIHRQKLNAMGVKISNAKVLRDNKGHFTKGA